MELKRGGMRRTQSISPHELNCAVSAASLRYISGLVVVLLTGLSVWGQAQTPSVKIAVDWNKTVLVSRSAPTFQVVVNPILNRGSSIHDAAFSAIHQLGAEYVRYVPWLPYPRLAVAELEPPTPTGTSWNFGLIDPMVEDFMTAQSGHSTVMNFSTIPAWLFKTPKPVTYPKDPNQVFWDYTQGTELVDTSGKALGDYYGRLVSWYTRGGFTDENGKFHASTHHYKLPVWEVFNEVDFEHNTTPEQYAARYDAVVRAIHAVSPDTKFMALALAAPSDAPQWFEYFLDHAHHQAGIPLDYISYHFYASPAPGETINDWQYTFFNQADRFLTTVRFINQIRDRLSPETKTDTDELGVILPNDNSQVADASGYVASIPKGYWNAAGALYAYLYVNLAKLGVDVIGESQLVGYPSQYPSVSMIDWVNGKPNARYWVLKLIKDNFQPGDKILDTIGDTSGGVTAQAFDTPTGRKLLLVNQRNRSIEVTLPSNLGHAESTTVDEASGEGEPRSAGVTGPAIQLAPFAVTVVRWEKE
jgi:hypothetical protein